MTQYLMDPKKESENLKTALEKYTPFYFMATPKSFSNKTIHIKKNLTNKTLNFQYQNNLIFLINEKEILSLPLERNHGFKVEYQDKKFSRIYPYYINPNDSALKKVPISALRNVVDDILIEIFFKGKIILEQDNCSNIWKIK